MSLDFRLGDIADRKDVCFGEDGYMRPVTESIIWATMTVKLGEITDDNALTFWLRYKVLAAATDSTPFFSLEDVERHVGLATNVTSIHSDSTWFKQVGVQAMKDTIARLRRARELTRIAESSHPTPSEEQAARQAKFNGKLTDEQYRAAKLRAAELHIERGHDMRDLNASEQCHLDAVAEIVFAAEQAIKFPTVHPDAVMDRSDPNYKP